MCCDHFYPRWGVQNLWVPWNGRPLCKHCDSWKTRIPDTVWGRSHRAALWYASVKRWFATNVRSSKDDVEQIVAVKVQSNCADCSLVMLVRSRHVVLLHCLKLFNNRMYCFVQLLILLKVEKLLSPPCTGRPSLKGPSTEAVLVTGFRDPVPTHKEIKILGGDWTSWGPIRSTLSPSPTEKIVAMKGSMVLRSALEIHSRTMATLILGKSTDCFLIGLNV